MFRFSCAIKTILSVMLLALTMVTASSSARSTPIFYNLFYAPLDLNQGNFGNTFIELTVFFDSSDFAGVNGELVVARKIDATLSFEFQNVIPPACPTCPPTFGPIQDGVISTSLPNNNTSTGTAPFTGAPINFNLIAGQFFGATSPGEVGAFSGDLRGIQPSVVLPDGSFDLFALSFSSRAQGFTSVSLFSQSNQFGKGTDTSLLAGVSGPFEATAGTVVSEPVTLLLFGAGLAGLAGFRRLRRAA